MNKKTRIARLRTPRTLLMKAKQRQRQQADSKPAPIKVYVEIPPEERPTITERGLV